MKCIDMFLFGKKHGQENQAGAAAPDAPSADDRKKEEDSINSFMSILKKQYNDGMISEKTFRETLAKNEEALKQIKKGNGAQTQKQEIKKENNENVSENTDVKDAADFDSIKEDVTAEKNKRQAKKNSAENDGAEQSDSKKGKNKRKKENEEDNNRQKTVGEILKEEGVIHDEEKQGKVKIEQEVDLNRMLMSIEKLTAEVEALRDIKFQSDERIKEISESIGEMRSLIFQRDGAIKEMQMKLEKMDDAIADVKPDKIAGEMRKREQ